MALLDSYERVIYERNPLVEVVSQIKFPTLLSIASNLPSEFQNNLIGAYPTLEVQRVFQVDVGSGNSGVIARTQYLFKSADGDWTVTLAPDFLALTTQNYVRWEEFEYRLREVITVLLGCYNIANFSRIGLRYRDVIDPQILGIDQFTWSDLIRPALLGVMAVPEFHDVKVDNVSSIATFVIDGVSVTLTTSSLVNQDNKSAFLIDSDFYQVDSSEAGVDYAIGTFRRLHEYSGPLFRFCITQTLHDALRPKPVK